MGRKSGITGESAASAAGRVVAGKGTKADARKAAASALRQSASKRRKKPAKKRLT